MEINVEEFVKQAKAEGASDEIINALLANLKPVKKTSTGKVSKKIKIVGGTDLTRQYMGVRWSLKKLSDAEFEAMLPQFAKDIQTTCHPYQPIDEAALRRDWQELLEWGSTPKQKAAIASKKISANDKVGNLLCEHFFPNIYHMRNKENKRFIDVWQDTTNGTQFMMRAIRQNRGKSLAADPINPKTDSAKTGNSYPTFREFRKNFWNAAGFSPATMYRALQAKLVLAKHKGGRVLDPCAGWGGRMLGALANDCFYVAFEPNTETYANLMELAKWLGKEDRVCIINDGAENMDKYADKIGSVDAILTSPPYYDVERYCDEATQSYKGYAKYADWASGWLVPTIKKALAYLKVGGVSYWNVAVVKGNDMWADVNSAHASAMFLPHSDLKNFIRNNAGQTQKDKTKKRDDDTQGYVKFGVWNPAP